VTTVQVNAQIEIAWSAPATNFEVIDAYEVLIQTSGGSYSATASCDAASAAVMALRLCRPALTVLTAAPYSLPAGTTVVATVRAHNARGWSAHSPANTVGAAITTIPGQMAAPVRDDASTTTAQIKVDWAALTAPATGMLSILSYNLQWDAGTSGASWTELIGESADSTATTFTVSSGVVPGQTYQFQVRARNALGWGALSAPPTSVKAATNPVKTANVASALDAPTGGVTFTWAAPDDAQSPIDYYALEIAYGGGPTWATETASCNAGTAPVATSRTCLVPMATLRAAPFNFVYGAVV
jgi:hypothetical protein